jgi:hypothetical protein
MGTFTIEEGVSGRVDTVLRTLLLSARQAVQEFGFESCSERVRTQVMDPKTMDERSAYLHVTGPREEDRRRRGRGQRGMPFESIYIDKASKHIVAESGYEEFPFFVARWSKTTDTTTYGPGTGLLGNSPWGYGPGHLALPDVKTLNKVKEWQLKALPLHLYPPGYTDDDSVIGTFDLTPGAINVVRRGATITPYQVGGNPQLVQLEIQDLVQSIERIFLRDQILALPKPGEGQMTAFEVAQRIERTQQVMGPAFNRLTYEQFDPLAARAFGLKLRAGALPEPPYEVLEAASRAGGRIKVQYEGPLAKAQRASELDAMLRLYQFAGTMAQMTGDVAVLDGLDHGEALRLYGEILGVPRKVQRSAQEVQQRAQERAEAQQQQAELSQQVQASEAARNMAPFMREVTGGQAA